MPTADSQSDERWMRRAIRLAMNGRGQVEPNPMVGCVIVKNDRVIGEGYHQKFGGPHAEPNALANCTESPEGATAYVTLEPCCHTNKKTPPCAPRLIEAKIGRVVIGCPDPNPDVDGRGVALLLAAGLTVDVLSDPIRSESLQLIAPFIKRTKYGHACVTLKWAESADRKVAGSGGRRVQITGAPATQVVHQLRANSDAIVVGINTVLTDDPLLTARGFSPSRPLLRIVLDSQLRIPLESQLVRTAKETPTLVLCDAETYGSSPTVAELKSHALEVSPWYDGDRSGRALLDAALLTARDPTHILVEPGPTLARSFLPWADRLWAFRSPKPLGGGSFAPTSADIPDSYMKTGEINIDGDVLTEYLNRANAAFFAPTPSADFVFEAEKYKSSVPIENRPPGPSPAGKGLG